MPLVTFPSLSLPEEELPHIVCAYISDARRWTRRTVCIVGRRTYHTTVHGKNLDSVVRCTKDLFHHLCLKCPQLINFGPCAMAPSYLASIERIEEVGGSNVSPALVCDSYIGVRLVSKTSGVVSSSTVIFPYSLDVDMDLAIENATLFREKVTRAANQEISVDSVTVVDSITVKDTCVELRDKHGVVLATHAVSDGDDPTALAQRYLQ